MPHAAVFEGPAGPEERLAPSMCTHQSVELSLQPTVFFVCLFLWGLFGGGLGHNFIEKIILGIGILIVSNILKELEVYQRRIEYSQ